MYRAGGGAISDAFPLEAARSPVVLGYSHEVHNAPTHVAKLGHCTAELLTTEQITRPMFHGTTYEPECLREE